MLVTKMQPISLFNRAYHATSDILCTISHSIIAIVKRIFSTFHRPTSQDHAKDIKIKTLEKEIAEKAETIKTLTLKLTLAENEAMQNAKERDRNNPRRELVKLQRTRTRQQATIVDLEDRLDRKDSEIRNLLVAVKRAQADIKHYQHALRTIQKLDPGGTPRLQAAFEKLKKFTARIDAADKNVRRCVRELEPAQTRHNEHASTATQTVLMQDESKQSQPNASDDETTITNLRKEIATLKEEVNRKEATLGELTSEMGSLTTELSNERRSNRALKESLNRAEGRASVDEQNIKALQDKLAASKNDAAQARHDALVKAQKNEQHIKALQEELVASKKDAAQARHDALVKAVKNEELEGLLEEAGEVGSELYKQFHQAKIEAENARRQLVAENKSQRRNSAPPGSPKR